MYGQFLFSLLCESGGGVALVRMAAAQGLDAALFKLANFYYYRDAESEDIAKDDQESLRLLLLSANQGYLPALFRA